MRLRRTCGDVAFCFLFSPLSLALPHEGGGDRKQKGRDSGETGVILLFPFPLCGKGLRFLQGGLARRSPTGRADRVGPLTPPHKEKDNGEGLRLSY